MEMALEKYALDFGAPEPVGAADGGVHCGSFLCGMCGLSSHAGCLQAVALRQQMYT